jgi:hypothetical protein
LTAWNLKQEGENVTLASIELHPDRIWSVYPTYFLIPVYEPRNRCKQEHLGEAAADHHAEPKALLITRTLPSSKSYFNHIFSYNISSGATKV